MEQLQIDEKYLKSIGLSTDDPENNKTNLTMVFGLLQERLDKRIMGLIGEEKMPEYYVACNKDDLFDVWVDKYVPNFDELVQEELAGLRDELNSDSDRFIKSLQKNNGK